MWRVVAVALVGVADAHLLRGGNPENDAVIKTEQAGDSARAGASSVRALSSEMGARLAAQKAERLSADTFSLSSAVDSTKPYVEGEVVESKKQEGDALMAASAAKATLRTMKLEQPFVVEKAAKLAATTTTKTLSPTAKQVQEWKLEVLHDPKSEAQRAAHSAAKPYDDALRTIEGRIYDYSERANSLHSQALGLQKTAKAVADGAVFKQAAQDFKGASADMMSAHQMMAQAQFMGAQALKVEQMAQQMQVMVPAYQAASQQAAAYMLHRFAPKWAPPPGVGALAFTPPPPPTGKAIASLTQVEK